MTEHGPGEAYAAEIILGTGSLNWPAGERKSDRYGLVLLLDAAEEPTHLGGPGANAAHTTASELAGTRGRLIARVVTPRASYHVGDVFRGIFPPEAPLAVGEKRVLGTGTLFFGGGASPTTAVGLEPEDGRPDDWLDPEVLYELHNSIIELFFMPHPAA
ncbi:MAG: hypothetical protein M3522_14945 [Actinomycetota bacterium]|nr:hypothetical protein [Actinomycetota bacterium]